MLFKISFLLGSLLSCTAILIAGCAHPDSTTPAGVVELAYDAIQKGDFETFKSTVITQPAKDSADEKAMRALMSRLKEYMECEKEKYKSDIDFQAWPLDVEGNHHEVLFY